MKRFWILLLALVVLAGVSTSTQAEESTTAYVGAKIIPIVGDDIERGVLIVKGGKIVEVRATDDRHPVGPADRHRPADRRHLG